MRSTLNLVIAAFLGNVSATRMPPSESQPERHVEPALKQIQNEISQLESALRDAFSHLTDLFHGHAPTTAAPLPTNLPGLVGTVTTLTAATSVYNAAALASSSIATLRSSLNAASSTLLLVTSTAGRSSTTETATALPSSSSAQLYTTSMGVSLSIPATPTTSLGTDASSMAAPFGTGLAAPSATGITSSNVTTTATTGCASLCSSVNFPSDLAAHPVSCTPYTANSTITIEGGQAEAQCGSTISPAVDLCRVALTVTTSPESEAYVEVWLPDGQSTWNGRTMSTDNNGVNGCVNFDDMQYASSLGFVAIGDNGGHNSSSFDGSWFQGSNEQILDWAGRSRHSSIVAGKAIVKQFYNKQADYSYYIGCSAGGWQGLKSAQEHPEDFDGIIAGSSATDFNHLQAWSGRFIQLTGTDSSDPRFLTKDQWITVQSAIFDQCDEALDGVADGILEDPTICQFDASVLSNSTYNLSDTQVSTVEKVFSQLYSADGRLLFPSLLYGSQVDAFRLGQLSGSPQAISQDWYKYAVVNDSSWNPLDMDQADYAKADELDEYHGNVSGYDGDLSAFHDAGGKLIMYHGLVDPLVTAAVSQRYYLKVAQTMGVDHTGMDDFLRLFRISGMAHCGVGGISGAGAWMFGQSDAASDASHSIIQDLQDWVEDGLAPETLTGTKFWWDDAANGVEMQRAHCKFPYRTTYVGGDAALAESWTCTYIDDWQECGEGATPRLCNADGSF